MKLLKYIWQVTRGIITTFVILVIFSSADSSSETYLYAFLTFILLYLSNFSFRWGKLKQYELLLITENFHKIRTLLNDPPNEYELEDLANAKRKSEKSIVSMIIEYVFQALIYAIALFNLLAAVLE